MPTPLRLRVFISSPGDVADERALVRERTQAGLTAARGRGRTGRCPKLTPDQRSEVLDRLAAGRTAAEVARIFRVHRATISRLAAQARVTQPR
jgi:DNA invertase Pin-like site-specific DNA recombinase